MTTREFFGFMKEIDRRMEREEVEKRKKEAETKKTETTWAEFPVDERRPFVGPPRMMRCG